MLRCRMLAVWGAALCELRRGSPTRLPPPQRRHSCAGAVAPPCTSSRSSCAGSQSGHHHEALPAVASLARAIRLCRLLGFQCRERTVANRGQIGKFHIPGMCMRSATDAPRRALPACRRARIPGNTYLIGRDRHQIPIGRAPIKPRRSTPRFPPSRFIQRLPTGIRASPTASRVGQTSNKPKPLPTYAVRANRIRFWFRTGRLPTDKDVCPLWNSANEYSRPGIPAAEQ